MIHILRVLMDTAVSMQRQMGHARKEIEILIKQYLGLKKTNHCNRNEK